MFKSFLTLNERKKANKQNNNYCLQQDQINKNHIS